MRLDRGETLVTFQVVHGLASFVLSVKCGFPSRWEGARVDFPWSPGAVEVSVKDL